MPGLFCAFHRHPVCNALMVMTLFHTMKRGFPAPFPHANLAPWDGLYLPGKRDWFYISAFPLGWKRSERITKNYISASHGSNVMSVHKASIAHRWGIANSASLTEAPVSTCLYIWEMHFYLFNRRFTLHANHNRFTCCVCTSTQRTNPTTPVLLSPYILTTLPWDCQCFRTYISKE